MLINRNSSWLRMLAVMLGTGLLTIGAFAGCSSENAVTEKASSVAKPQTIEEKADAIVAAMTTNEKIGQMVMIGVHGTDIDDDSKAMLRQFHIGGVIYFDRNIKSQMQLKAFSEHLQAYAQGEEAHQKVPLFIGIDEEGGIVSRGKGVIPVPESEQAIGASGKPELAQASAVKTAQALKEVGINLNMAPVADVGSKDTRSFASDANTVTLFTGKAADGYEQEGMMYALKHFPGIGKGKVDSHKEVSRVDASKGIMEKEDLVPFAEMIKTRRPENYMILVSHLIYPCYDPDYSASQSSAVMTNLLRGKLGYKGIIITDDLEMGAVANHVSMRRIGVNAVKAGADIVLVCHEYPHEEDVYMGLKDAVDSGEITEDRLNESVRRIVMAKLANKL